LSLETTSRRASQTSVCCQRFTLGQEIRLTSDLANNRIGAIGARMQRRSAKGGWWPAWLVNRKPCQGGTSGTDRDESRRRSGARRCLSPYFISRSSPAVDERMLRENGRRHVSCSGSTPARGEVGRGHDLLRKFRTATRPIAFAAAHARGVNDRRSLEDVGCKRGAQCRRSKAPLRTDKPSPRSYTRTLVRSTVSNPRMG
jgi:hypothetical protein